MLNPWFVTGFCDGEAAFTFSRSGNQFSLYFSITQRDDNREIIEKIQRHFKGIGAIYTRKEQLPMRNSGHTKPNAYFRVCRQGELTRVIDHFDKFPLQSKKKEVYALWREMALNKIRYSMNCKCEEFQVFSEKLALLNQKSRAFKKRIEYA
jgi:hypothetical protein